MTTTEHRILDLDAIAPPEVRAAAAELLDRVNAMKAEADWIFDAFLALDDQVDDLLAAFKDQTRASLVAMGSDPKDSRLGDFEDGTLWFVYSITGMTAVYDALAYVANRLDPDEIGEVKMDRRKAKAAEPVTAGRITVAGSDVQRIKQVAEVGERLAREAASFGRTAWEAIQPALTARKSVPDGATLEEWDQWETLTGVGALRAACQTIAQSAMPATCELPQHVGFPDWFTAADEGVMRES